MVHFVQRSGATRSRRLQSKSRLLWGYMGKVTFNPRLQQVRIVVVEEASTWESVPHTSDSMEKSCLSGAYTSPMEYITKVMRMARYNFHVCVFEPWKLELVALRNILRLNTCYGNSDKSIEKLMKFRLWKRVTKMGIIHHPRGREDASEPDKDWKIWASFSPVTPGSHTSCWKE